MQGGGSEVETTAPRGGRLLLSTEPPSKNILNIKQTINKTELKKKVLITAKFPEQLKVDVYATK